MPALSWQFSYHVLTAVQIQELTMSYFLLELLVKWKNYLCHTDDVTGALSQVLTSVA